MNALSSRTLLLPAVLTALACGASPTLAAKLSCKPDVTIYNHKGGSIKALNFKYKVAGDDRVFTEGLNNRKIGASGDHETWKSQTLKGAADGVTITSIAIEYKDDNSGNGDGYGKREESSWFSQSGACNNNRTYTVSLR
jgi:hypothetical protein